MLDPDHSDKAVRSEQDTDLISFKERDLETASGSAWHLRAENDVSSEAIEQAIGGPSLLAQVLAGRGIRADNAHAFLNPSLKTDLPDPLILKDMDRAIDRLASAVHAGETIGVFGDYDVDGTTSSAILREYFDCVGVRSHVRLPDRQLDGYGPNLSAFEFLKGEGASIVITVDCGANAPEVVAAGKNLGLDIIVVDHHQMEGAGPDAADAVVNPCREDDTSGLNGFSASGLVFLLVVGLNRKLRQDDYFADRDEPDLKGLLDLAALGLVCDVMPLTGAVRTIVAQGLKVLSARKEGPGNRGLLALCDAAGAKTPYSGYTFGFQLGPRINAAGRISHADLAFELLTTDDDHRRESLADQLHSINAERQAIEANVQAEAVAIVNCDRLADDAPIVVAAEGWHPGVLGIVAGRLKEKYGRPTVVIGIDEDGTGKGSGRSVSGVDLGKAIRDCYTDGILVAGGGHAMAAGLTISATNIDQFREVLTEHLRHDIAIARRSRSLKFDGVAALSAASRDTVNALAKAGPFGAGNPEPVFLFEDVVPLDTRPVGAGHLSLQLMDLSGASVRAIAFRAIGERLGDLLSSEARLHVLGKIRPDDWRGPMAAQIDIVDVAKA